MTKADLLGILWCIILAAFLWTAWQVNTMTKPVILFSTTDGEWV